MRFDRLRQLTAAELGWRARERLRTFAEWTAVQSGRARWDRQDLRRALSPAALDRPLRDAIGREDWDVAGARMIEAIARRPARYVLDPARAARLRDDVAGLCPDARVDAAHRADRLIEGHYDLLGYRGLAFRDRDGQIDWHLDPVHGRRGPRRFWAQVPYLDAATGDHKVIWELNRHQHWMRFGRALWLTGDVTYANAIAWELASWLAANPPLVGINWASTLEVAFRSLSWTWALHCLLGSQGAGCGDRGSGISPSWIVDLLVGLDRHLTHVERHLSHYFSPNTHLTGEALALYVVGTALPELAGSARWIATGRRILVQEIDRQILPDGGHVERSTHYQRYTLDFYLLALLTARVAGDRAAAGTCADAARRLAEFTQTIAGPDGMLPLIGDDDGGMLWPLRGRECRDVRDSLSLAAMVFDRPDLAPWGMTEEAIWIGGTATSGRLSGLAPSGGSTVTPPSSRLLPDTGYFVARDARGSHAVFDAGRHGYMNSGHAHADALAVTLTLNGRPLLIDPGTSTYTMEPRLRDRMRASASHNTVTLDGRSQSVAAGPFHWHSQTHALVHAHGHHAAFDWIEASHQGYAPAEHRRTMLRTTDDGWLFVDEIRGGEMHRAAAHWHFDPAWFVEHQAPQLLRAVHTDGTIAWLLHDGDDAALFHGDEEPGLGWYAPVYGTLLPTWTARITRTRRAPFSIITWVGSSNRPPSLTRPENTTDCHDAAVTVRVDHDDRIATFQIRPGTGLPPTLRLASRAQKDVPPLVRV